MFAFNRNVVSVFKLVMDVEYPQVGFRYGTMFIMFSTGLQLKIWCRVNEVSVSSGRCGYSNGGYWRRNLLRICKMLIFKQ